MRNAGRFALMLALAACAVHSWTAWAKAEITPPSVSIQEGKFEDLRPSSERARFNNLKPLIEMIKHELFEGGFAVKDERDLRDAFEEGSKSQVMDGMEGDAPVQGALKIPAYFLRLKVLQYGFQTVTANNVMSGGKEERKYLHAQMTATIIDARTGGMVGSANVKAGPIAVATLNNASISQSGNHDEQMLQSLNQTCAQQIVAYLAKKTPAKFRPSPMSVTGKVLKVADYGILVKIDQEKVKIGTALDVFNIEKLDLEDDEEDGEKGEGEEEDEDLVEEIYVGSVEVTEIKPKYVVCSPITLNAKFDKKQLVRPSTRYGAKAAKPQVAPAQRAASPSAGAIPAASVDPF